MVGCRLFDTLTILKHQIIIAFFAIEKAQLSRRHDLLVMLIGQNENIFRLATRRTFVNKVHATSVG